MMRRDIPSDEFLHCWSSNKTPVKILLDNGDLIVARLTRVDKYSVGLVPAKEYKLLGLEEGVESWVSKSFLWVVTPLGGSGDAGSTKAL